eukprot:m.227307 g.227307  ORF g.227307 m.227307 type:complete len:94 (+) comp17184_c0_seq1:1257-1538(+)
MFVCFFGGLFSLVFLWGKSWLYVLSLICDFHPLVVPLMRMCPAQSLAHSLLLPLLSLSLTYTPICFQSFILSYVFSPTVHVSTLSSFPSLFSP